MSEKSKLDHTYWWWPYRADATARLLLPYNGMPAFREWLLESNLEAEFYSSPKEIVMQYMKLKGMV